ILKPSHGARVLRNEAGTGFSPKAAYILKKQLEEADAILVNRIDEIEPGEIGKLTTLVEEKYPGRPILKISARTGAGCEALLALLEQEGDFGRRVLDIDYDIYAEGEAELGWLNASIRVAGKSEFKMDDLLLAVVKRLARDLDDAGAETAHL